MIQIVGKQSGTDGKGSTKLREAVAGTLKGNMKQCTGNKWGKK